MKEQIQQALFPEKNTESRIIFIKNYLQASVEEREELQNSIISSSYMQDFIALSYAMWMVENNQSVEDIDEKYVEFVSAGEFKFFAIPQSDSLGLKVTNRLAELEEEFDFMYEQERVLFKDKTIELVRVNNPNASDEQLVEMSNDMLMDSGFSTELWSADLTSVFEQKNRCYWIYIHLMETMAKSAIDVKDQKISFNVKDLFKEQYDNLQNLDLSDFRSISFLRQKLLSAGDKQKVFFGKVQLNCRATEIILFLTRGYNGQENLVELFLMKDLSMHGRFSRVRRLLSAAPYLSEKSLNVVVEFLKPVLMLQSSDDADFLDYVLDSPFIPEGLADSFEELLSPILDAEVLENLQKNPANDANNVAEYQMKLFKLFQEAVNELPNELREKFDFNNKDNMNFLNLEFDSPDGVTKDSIKEKILAVVSKMDSNAHEDITSLANILYDWYSSPILQEKMDEATQSLAPMAESSEKIEVFNKMSKAALKPKIIFTMEMQKEIDELKEELPNFAEVIDFVVTEVKLNLMYSGKMSFTPILLLGDAGLGKTYVAKRLAEILKTAFEFLDFGSTSSSWILKGSAPSWKGASIGKILSLMIKSETINPIVLYDEIDKGVGNSRDYPPEVVLYQLFEKNNAVLFEDEFVSMPFDASTVINICTANTVNSIPSPLQSRMHIFKIEKLDEDQTKALAKKMYKKMVSNYNVFSDELSDELLEDFKELTPREIDRNLKSFMIQNVKSMPMTELLESRKNKINLKKFDVVVNREGTIGF